MIKFVITDSIDEGKRLDQYLVSNLSDISRSQIQKHIKSGSILVNGKLAKTGYSLLNCDKISVLDSIYDIEKNDLIPEPIKINIIYEDLELAVINKQSGMVIHPGVGHLSGTLVNGLLYHFNSLSNINGETRPGIVHRLDADTSGVLVIAKNNKSHKFLADQFQNRTIKKKYTALTWGDWSDDSGEISAPIGRNKKDPTIFEVIHDGRQSLTHFKIKKQFRHLSLVSFYPKTGRTHQIRVHASYLGHPIFGDEKYGGGANKTKGFLPEFTKIYQNELLKFNRHALHASSIEFIHPTTKNRIKYSAPLSKNFLNLIKSIEAC